MMDVSKLEPFGLSILAGGLLYSIGVLTVNPTDCRFHFIVLVLIIFFALFAITAFKYIKYRNSCEKMDDYMQALKIE